MEDCVDQFLMELICFSGIEQGVIDVRCPVIKGREKEAKLRRDVYKRQISTSSRSRTRATFSPSGQKTIYPFP